MLQGANESADGRDFILRLFTLGLPISVRFMALGLLVGVFLGLLEASLDPDFDTELESTATSTYEVAFIVALMAAYYWYFALKLKSFGSVDANATLTP